MKQYTLKKNGIIEHMWDSSTGDETYYEPSFGDPSEYVVEQIDLTEKNLQNKKVEDRFSLIQKGQKILAFVITLNEKKYAAQELSMADLVAMESYQPLLDIERQIMRGTIATAKYSLQNYSGLYYNSSDISLILEKINEALGA